MAGQAAPTRRRFSREEYYRMAEAGILSANDVLLLIEAADTSLAYDRTTKLRLYAESGIPEYWIVDCNTESVEIYRGPSGNSYRDVARASGTTALTLRAFSDVSVATAEIFA